MEVILSWGDLRVETASQSCMPDNNLYFQKQLYRNRHILNSVSESRQGHSRQSLKLSLWIGNSVLWGVGGSMMSSHFLPGWFPKNMMNWKNIIHKRNIYVFSSFIRYTVFFLPCHKDCNCNLQVYAQSNCYWFSDAFLWCPLP